ncbi:hypothetical protein [Shivajiella indica]|uniref:Prenyltransferase n=1 Tax=Shivajiella indica TaxID=872115 RepID=A0ABW5B3K7_9BACT
MYTLKSIWHFFNILSLDVVIGAMAGMLFFADVLDVDLTIETYLLLALAVWSVYTLDHLVDAKKMIGNASSKRHQFHQQNFRILSGALVFCVILDFVILFSTRSLNFIIIPGFVLGMVMLIWMGQIHFFGRNVSWLKEISTAIFYVLGISLAPFFKLFPDEIPFPFYLLLLGYFTLALINLLILSFLDEKGDKKDGFGSILQHVQKSQLKKYIQILGLTSALITLMLILFLPSYFKIHASILFLLILFHILEFQKKDRCLTRQKLEFSFLFPFVLLLF